MASRGGCHVYRLSFLWIHLVYFHPISLFSVNSFSFFLFFSRWWTNMTAEFEPSGAQVYPAIHSEILISQFIQIFTYPSPCPPIHSSSLIATHCHSTTISIHLSISSNVCLFIHFSHPSFHGSAAEDICMGQTATLKRGLRQRACWKVVNLCERRLENKRRGKERWRWVPVSEGWRCLCWPLISILHPSPSAALRVNRKHPLLVSLVLLLLLYSCRARRPF